MAEEQRIVPGEYSGNCCQLPSAVTMVSGIGSRSFLLTIYEATLSVLFSSFWVHQPSRPSRCFCCAFHSTSTHIKEPWLSEPMLFNHLNESAETQTYIHYVHKKCDKVFLTVTTKIADRIPSNLAHSVSDQYFTMQHKKIHFNSRMYTHYLVRLRLL